MIRQAEDTAEPESLLSLLYTQLRVLVPVLTMAPEGTESILMLAGLRDTADRATHLLTSAEPGALTAIERALDHMRARRPSQACSELLNARSRLAVLLRRDSGDVQEPTAWGGPVIDAPAVEAPS